MAMKEHPILFSSDMVRAILEGRKSQTRRVLNRQPSEIYHTPTLIGEDCWGFQKPNQGTIPFLIKCPYGQPSDRLYVRETHYRFGRWELTGELTKTGKPEWEFIPETDVVLMWDTPPLDNIKRKKTERGWFKRPSIFLPRWASRITLEITGIRVERVQEISEEDAKAEGVIKPGILIGNHTSSITPLMKSHGELGSLKYGFYALWDSINAKRGYSWDANPWVWVIEFRRVEK